MKLIIYLSDENIDLFYLKSNKLLKTLNLQADDIKTVLKDRVANCKQVAILLDSIEEEIVLDWAPKLNFFDKKSFIKHKVIKTNAVFHQKTSWIKRFLTEGLIKQQYKTVKINKFQSLDEILEIFKSLKKEFKIYLLSTLIKDLVQQKYKIKHPVLVGAILEQIRLKQILILNNKILFNRIANISDKSETETQHKLALEFIDKNNILPAGQELKSLIIELSKEKLVKTLYQKDRNYKNQVFYQYIPKKTLSRKSLVLTALFILLLSFIWFFSLQKTYQKPIQLAAETITQPGLVIAEKEQEDFIQEVINNNQSINQKNLIKFQALIEINNQTFLQINNKLFKPNEMFNQLKIIQIEKDNIRVEFAGKEKRIKIGQVYDLNRWPEADQPTRKFSLEAKN